MDKSINNKQLTSIEIEKIRTFVNDKGIKYLDLQSELVDHIANSIEHNKLKNSDLTFNHFLFKVYDDFKTENKFKFPVSNFYNILKEREKMLKMYWQNNMFAYIKVFFKIPKIVITILLILMFYALISNDKNYALIILTSGFYIVLFATIFLYFKYKKDKDKLLIIHSFINYYMTYLVLVPYSTISLIINLELVPIITNTLPGMFLLSVLIGIWIILVYGSVFVFPKKLKSDIIQKYPYQMAYHVK